MRGDDWRGGRSVGVACAPNAAAIVALYWSDADAQNMSRPRTISLWETVGLLSLGAITVFCLMPTLRNNYADPHLRTSLFATIGACLIYPAAILIYARKAISQRNGDWKLTVFILFITFALFHLVR